MKKLDSNNPLKEVLLACEVNKFKSILWKSLILPNELKEDLINTLEFPLRHFEKDVEGVLPNVLLYGVPG